MKTFSSVLSVTTTTVTVPFSSDNSVWFASEPAVFIQCNGNAAAVAWVPIMQNVGAAGIVQTGITVTFDAGAVGKKFSINVMGA